MKRVCLTGLGILLAVLFAACGSGSGEKRDSSTAPSSGETETASVTDSTAADQKEAADSTAWVQITQEEAARIMSEETGYQIVDVRRRDEYDEGHIPGAICIPNESIGTNEIPELPDKEQTLLVYCRSGRRSKEAAGKLAKLGYSDVREFGGIIDWTGEIVTGETENAAAAAADTEETAEAILPAPTLVIEAGGRTFYAGLEDNSSAEAFAEKISSGPLEVELHDYGNFEKVGPLPWELPTNDEQITTGPGDVILYQGNQITIYYDENTWSFTRLANIGSVTKEELLEALGDGDVTVTFWIEWSE